MVFKDLGLVIVDEEQRFGVKQKERLKEWRRTVDVLTLTATPIPRPCSCPDGTQGAEPDQHTPPEDRRAVRTYLCRPERGGDPGGHPPGTGPWRPGLFRAQPVRNLGTWTRHVQEMVPDARVAMAHGQMPERDLERVMMRFWHKEVDVLVCTAIIEAGLDIPAANTIIINRAHTLGWRNSISYRGRVGRSQAQAYAYLLVPDEAALSTEAQKRLKALMEFTELGPASRSPCTTCRSGGPAISWAGAIGPGGRGGYELYLQLLESAIREFKGEPEDLAPGPGDQVPLAAYLPEDYVPDSSSAWLCTGAFPAV